MAWSARATWARISTSSLPLRDRIHRGEASGPEIVAAGPMLDNAPADWPFRRRVTNAQKAREAVRDLKRRGVDFIKVHNNTPREVFFAIAEEGAASGMRTIEHFLESRVFRECAGTSQSYDAGRCRPLFDEFAARGIWQTPTLAFFRALPEVFSGKPMPHADYATDSLLELTRKNIEVSKLDERALSLIRSLSRTSLTVVRDMLPRGNAFLAGCDGSVPGFCLHDELQILTEAGLSPLQAIQAAPDCLDLKRRRAPSPRANAPTWFYWKRTRSRISSTPTGSRSSSCAAVCFRRRISIALSRVAGARADKSGPAGVCG
jgi:hypothetical protein